jgi:predicted ABC-type ATPase
MEIPRLRMFAGPNGSGKSTIKSVVSSKLLGHYLNPDEIEKEIKDRDYLDIRGYNIQTNEREIRAFFDKHPLIEKTELGDFTYEIKYIQSEFIDFRNVGIDSYMSAILTDFLRHKYLETHQSFTFETVMSSPDKVEILKKAQQLGYKTYLYFVATEDPAINVLRINHRVKMGGHPVPTDKVIARYYRSLDLLFEAIKYTNRAYIFDNSGDAKTWIAEITNGIDIEFKSENIPLWFEKNVLQKFIQP